MHRDYAPKNVKFFFIYKTLAHPELAGNYVQPFTLDERLAHARQAQKQLGATIPWIVDAMDNRLKHALGDRPNSEFLIGPDGVVLRKRAWSHPGQVRKDLEELVGTVDHVTREDDIKLNLELPPKAAAPRGITPRLQRPEMRGIVMQPKLEPAGLPFFAKLRVEADADLLTRGDGRLYLGFHLDPFHNAHWNNLTEPLSFQIDKVDGVTIDQWQAASHKRSAASDTDPREFLLKVSSWPADTTLRLTVTYFACVGEVACHRVEQEYVLHRRQDEDAGGARGEGAGFWQADEFAQRMLAGDKNQDGRLARSECAGIILPHFEKLDANRNGTLEPEELLLVADWLNHHHQPSPDAASTPRPQNTRSEPDSD